MRQVILDTETTGLSPAKGHRIIEIGAIELNNRRLTGNDFHRYINPQRQIDDGAIRVHGLTEQFLSDKPLFIDVVDEFIEFIQGAELIIHNAPFDIGFLNHEIKLCGAKHKYIETYCTIIDTLSMARKLHSGQRNSLDALCKRYGIDHSGRTLHGALLDAELLADVYLAMTGGQGDLFAEKEADTHLTTKTHDQTISATSKHQATKILSCGEDELNSHAKYIKHLESKGTCVWSEYNAKETE